MGNDAKWEYFRVMYERYHKAERKARAVLLDEFCVTTGYNRKYAIRLLNGPRPEKERVRRPRERKPQYGKQVISVLAAVWEAAGYPWSVRLKALLPSWMPWIRKRYRVSAKLEQQLLTMSARQMDRRLESRTRQLIAGKQREAVVVFSPQLYEGQVRGLYQGLDRCWREVEPMGRHSTVQAAKQRLAKICARQYVRSVMRYEVEQAKQGPAAVRLWCDWEEYRRLTTRYFGLRLLITDRTEWTTAQIIGAYRGDWRQSFFPVNDKQISLSFLTDTSSSRGCGKRGNPAGCAGFPREVGREGNRLLVFLAFHGPAFSTAQRRPRFAFS